jgi:anti-anti-sigma factor
MTIASASKWLKFELVEAPATGVASVRLAGALDVSSQQTAERFLADLVTAGHTHLALDCAELAFVSSDEQQGLIGTVKLVKPRSSGLPICAPQPLIRQLVELSGLEPLLCLNDTVAAGRVALGG